MSGKRTSDYKRLFQVVKKELATTNITEVVADFEASMWKAISREIPALSTGPRLCGATGLFAGPIHERCGNRQLHQETSSTTNASA